MVVLSRAGWNRTTVATLSELFPAIGRQPVTFFTFAPLPLVVERSRPTAQAGCGENDRHEGYFQYPAAHARQHHFAFFFLTLTILCGLSIVPVVSETPSGPI